MSAAHILLVDDHPANLLALEAVLEGMATFVTASSGEEALERVAERDFAAILLDVQMRGLDGFETAKIIRSREKDHHTPIIFLTAYDHNRLSVEEAYNLGAVDYLVKPLVPAILKAKVAQFIDLYHKTEQAKRHEEQLRQLDRREFELKLAEENAHLREQRELFHTTLSSIGDAVITTDTAGKVTFLNPVAQALTGWSPLQAIGTPLETVFHIVHETTRETVENPAKLALLENRVVGLASETVLIAKDGIERAVDDSAAPIRDQAGQVIGVVLVFRDVSQRRRGEIELAERVRAASLAADVGKALTTGRNLRETLQICTESLVRHLDGAFARIWTLDRHDDTLVLQASAGLYTHIDGPHGRVPVGQFKVGMIAASRKPHLTNSVVGDPLVPEQEWARREGMVAFAGYPLVVNDQLVGVMALFARHPLTGTSLDAMAAVADEIAVGIERRGAEAALQASQARKGSILHASLDAIITMDHQGKIVEFNPAAEAMFGYSLADAIGKEMADLIIPTKLQQQHREGLVRYLATGEGPVLNTRLELPARRANGSEFLAELTITRLQGPGAPLFTGFLRDVTARRMAEESLRQSQEQFHSLADSIPQLAWMARPDGHIYWYNRRWFDYTGTTLETMEGWGWQSVHDPRELPRVVAKYKAAIESGTPWEDVFPLRRHDGAMRWHLSRALPLRDERGKIVRWFGTNTDVEERRQADRHRDFLVGLGRLILTSTNPGEVLGEVLRATGEHLAVSRCSYAEIDYERGVFVVRRTHCRDVPNHAGTYTLESFGSGVLSEIRKGLTVVNTDTQSDPRTAHVYQATLAQLEIRSFVAVPLVKDGRCVATLAIHQNVPRNWTVEEVRLLETVAERSMLALENARLYEELRAADRRKDEFLATLAHELRNPLAPIRNSLQVMRIAGDGDAAPQVRDIIDRQVEQMVRLVDDLLDVSRISQGKIKLRTARIDLASAVQSAVEISQPVIDKGGHQLSVSLPQQAIFVEGDLTRLAQAFSNLLNNAAKYTEPGGRISLQIERAGSDAVLTVRDTGVGIPSEALPHIFDMFTQVNRSLDRSQGGLGIGLSLVRSLIELHGGRVEARSAGHGQGSEFIVRLPVLLEQQPALQSPADSQSCAKDYGESKRRILVVDDNKDSATTLSMLLKVLGHEVQTVYDGLAAVEVARTCMPDVVLLDIGLPKLNGYDAARQIRQQPHGANMLLIALTGWGQDEDRLRSEDAGFDHHMVKPVELTTLQVLLAREPQRA